MNKEKKKKKREKKREREREREREIMKYKTNTRHIISITSIAITNMVKLKEKILIKKFVKITERKSNINKRFSGNSR